MTLAGNKGAGLNIPGTGSGIGPPGPPGTPAINRFLVFDPNGIAGGNVYTTWASLSAALAALPLGEQPIVSVVSVSGVPTVYTIPLAGMPVGGWPMNGATLSGTQVTASGDLILDLPAGVQLDNLLQIESQIFLRTNNAPLDPPVLNFSLTAPGSPKFFLIGRGSAFQTTAGGPVIETAGGGDSVSFVLLTGCVQGAFFLPPLVGPLVKINVGDQAIAVQISTIGGFPQNWLEGPIGSTVIAITDSSGTLPSEWGAAFVGTVGFVSFQGRNGLQGTTAERPSTGPVLVGMQFFDTTIGLPIWFDGAIWIDAAGAPA